MSLKSHSPAQSDAAREQDADDRVLVAKNDLLGMLAIFVFGRSVYGLLAWSLGGVLVGAIAVMVSARVLGFLVEAVRAGTGGVFKFAATFLALEVFAVLAQYLGRIGLARATIEVTYSVRMSLFDKMARLPMRYFDTQPLGRTITRLTSDVEGLETFFGGTLARVVTACITVVTVLVAMLATDFGFGLQVVAVSLPALLFSVALRKPVREWLRLSKRRAAHVNAMLAEQVAGLPVIRTFGLEAWTKQRYGQAANDLLKAGLMAMNWNSLIRPVTVLLCSFPSLAILWFGGERVISGAMELGILIAYVRYSERFVSPIRTISQEIQNIQEALVSSERVRKMLAEPEEEQAIGPDGSQTNPIIGAVSYRDVWMAYDPHPPVLRGVSFEVPAGTRVGMVGRSGSGKTSSLSLLPRLYPFQRGSITIDGIPIEAFQRHNLRSQIAYVAQDVAVFSGTVRANLLATAQPGIGTAEIMQACCRTGLDTILARLPGGLDHHVLEGDGNLSMGERQLIAFTRVLLSDPRILILDEATASIDEELEALVQKASFELMKGRTSFVIAHRLATVKALDLVLVFEDGRVIEQGAPDVLLKQGGAFAQLAGRQRIAEMVD